MYLLMCQYYITFLHIYLHLLGVKSINVPRKVYNLPLSVLKIKGRSSKGSCAIVRDLVNHAANQVVSQCLNYSLKYKRKLRHVVVQNTLKYWLWRALETNWILWEALQPLILLDALVRKYHDRSLKSNNRKPQVISGSRNWL